MSNEIIALILTAIAGITAAIKALAEARRAKYESEARITEALRADRAEKTTDAVIKGIQSAKKTMSEPLAQHLQDEIRHIAIIDGVEDNLNSRVSSIKKTEKLDRARLLDSL